ncbi:MAG: hypothetical protein DRJ52_03615 [Thermoprotei archaeon]|nr:MAG: hypothetical protein DRJ52_03615 [Thermoprotei archaeon]RLF00793.1 MAG: hypothetical protein DRJ63_01405 [Thermoprotei archaeon]HDI74523.1 hypothetical protein [Thermoprotei archaeon]
MVSLVYLWAITMILAAGFSLGYYSYMSIKRKFDKEYGRKGLFFKRVIHGVVYILLLLLIHEAITVRLGSTRFSRSIEALALMFLVFIGVPIFVDITLSLYKMTRKH